MGLYVSHIKNLPYGERTLYVYLLDYGWPEGPYEKIFRDNFQAMAQRASETGSIVIASHRGVHFANEVLNWHSIAGIESDAILPAILVTKTHPNYFIESTDESRSAGVGLAEMVLIPLKKVCTSPDEFSTVIESIFADLEKGLDLRNFRVAKNDVSMSTRAPSGWRGIATRIGKSIILEPNISGIGVDLKKLFSPS